MDGTILKVVSMIYPDNTGYLAFDVIGVWGDEDKFNKWYEENVTDNMKDFVKVEEVPLNFCNEFRFNFAKSNIKEWRGEL